MSRDRAQDIKEMLGLLEKYWLLHPELRLGQLIDNFTSRTDGPEGGFPSVFYVPDRDLARRISSALKEGR
jgi:hypothetical protein